MTDGTIIELGKLAVEVDENLVIIHKQNPLSTKADVQTLVMTKDDFMKVAAVVKSQS